MKKKYLILIYLLFFCLNPCFSDQLPTVKSNTNNRFSFGLTGFYLDLDADLIHLKFDDDLIEIDGVLSTKKNGFFIGGTLNYQYQKPNFLYFNIDFSLSGSETNSSSSLNGIEYMSASATLLVNAEGDFGYTFSLNKSLMTPFIGIGDYFLGDSLFYQNEPYILIGGLFHHSWSSIFESGFLIKLLYSWRLFQFYVSNDVLSAGRIQTAWGTEVALPLYWHIADSGGWDVKLEPYFLKLSFSDTQNIYGTRLSLGINF